MKGIFSIDIPRRAASCLGCNASFMCEMEIHSSLIPKESDSKFGRQDFCLACLKLKQPGMQFSWKSSIPKKVEERLIAKKVEEKAMLFLLSALENDNLKARAEAFILSLYLARKRLLVPRTELTSAEKGNVMFYEVVATQELLCVPKVNLSEIQLSTLQTQLTEKFNA